MGCKTKVKAGNVLGCDENKAALKRIFRRYGLRAKWKQLDFLGVVLDSITF